MSKVFPEITDELRRFIEAQPMFFVGTAPSGDEGRVNVSPKGYRDTFAVVDEHTVAYLDLYGSGAETIAHLRQNGRIVVMFCSFDRRSRIVRLHGHGRVLRPDAPEYAGYAARFGSGHPGERAVIVIDVTRISDSCGWTIPYMELKGERPVLDKVQSTHSMDEWDRRARGNVESIDGLPALDADHPRPVPAGGSGGPMTALLRRGRDS
ncbi:pyridoxamine 5'-phosphate oxidase family protein [Streptomyces sp. NPDC013455]|uniref:pyridoxamine 5'-phosphate oxidase family protein n=1 Tax=Streptomyces sp. NPDC013455 TaxID=3155605 RepID=UPI0033F060EB